MEKIKDVECYLRLNLLNIEGVTPLLQSIVLKIASLTYGNNIEGVLTLFKKELEKVVGKESFKLLFPIDGTPLNVSKWDITLTSSVLLNCFTIERKLDQLRRILEEDMEQTGSKNDLQAYRRAKENDLFSAKGQQITVTQYKNLRDAETVEELGADLIICMVLICGSEKGKDNLYEICENILLQEIELDFNNRIWLNSYLNNKKRKIVDLKNDLTIFDAEFRVLYPDHGPSGYNTWNKNLLVVFVLNACERLNRSSQVELKTIRNIRNKMTAHKGKAELTLREFLPIWTDLFGAIKSLLKEEGMNVNEFEERVKYFKDGDLDVQSAIEMLRNHYMEESNEYQVLKATFGDIEERIVEKMETYKRKVQNLLESTNLKIRDFACSMDSFVKKRSVVMYNHDMEIPCVDIKIVVKGNDKRAVSKAHKAIIEAIKDPTGDERKKRKAITKILEIIERDGSTVIEVRKGSVIARVKCKDLEGVSSLLINIDSEDWVDTINELTTDIGQELKSHFTIEANITEESIQMLTDDIHQKDIQCQAASISQQLEKRPYYVKDIRVSHQQLWSHGSVVLPNQQLLLADNPSKKVKLIDTNTGTVLSNISLIPGNPTDITKVEKNEFAVLIKNPNKIQILSLSQNAISSVRKISISSESYGLAYNDKDKLFVVACYSPGKVELITIAGSVIKTIQTDPYRSPLFGRLYCVALTPDRSEMYVTDIDKNAVILLSLKGEVKAVYKDKELDDPRGIYVHKSGAVYVTGHRSHTIHQLNRETGKFHLLHDYRPHSISYSDVEDKMYVGMFYGPTMQVFEMK